MGLKNRTLNRLYARANGYFWLPCPFPGCTEMFGGHEYGKYMLYCFPDEPYRSKLTCRLHDDEPQSYPYTNMTRSTP